MIAGAFTLNAKCRIGLSLKHIELVTGSLRSTVYKIDKWQELKHVLKKEPAGAGSF